MACSPLFSPVFHGICCWQCSSSCLFTVLSLALKIITYGMHFFKLYKQFFKERDTLFAPAATTPIFKKLFPVLCLACSRPGFSPWPYASSLEHLQEWFLSTEPGVMSTTGSPWFPPQEYFRGEWRSPTAECMFCIWASEHRARSKHTRYSTEHKRQTCLEVGRGSAAAERRRLCTQEMWVPRPAPHRSPSTKAGEFQAHPLQIRKMLFTCVPKKGMCFRQSLLI